MAQVCCPVVGFGGTQDELRLILLSRRRSFYKSVCGAVACFNKLCGLVYKADKLVSRVRANLRNLIITHC